MHIRGCHKQSYILVVLSCKKQYAFVRLFLDVKPVVELLTLTSLVAEVLFLCLYWRTFGSVTNLRLLVASIDLEMVEAMDVEGQAEVVLQVMVAELVEAVDVEVLVVLEAMVVGEFSFSL